MNIETNLQPTFEFYEECVGTEGAVGALVSNPRLFTASVERRLKPRREEAATLLGLSMDSIMLSRMAKYKEEEWSNFLAKHSLAKQLKDGGGQLW